MRKLIINFVFFDKKANLHLSGIFGSFIFFLSLIVHTIVFSQNAPVTKVTTVINATTGAQIAIPVTVQNFNNVAFFMLTLRFDTTKIKFQSSVMNAMLPGMTTTYTRSTYNRSATLTFLWFSGSNVSLSDNTAITNLNFIYLMGTSALSWSFYGDDICTYYTYIGGNYSQLNDSPLSSYYINGAISNRVAPHTYAAVIPGPSPGGITLPLAVTGFNDIGAFTLYLEYNPLVLTYQGSFTKNTNLSGNMVVGNQSVTSGLSRIVISYLGTAAAVGNSLVNGSSIVSLNFLYSNTNASYSPLNWYEIGPTCEYTDGNSDVLIDWPADSFYTNGNVGVFPYTASISYSASPFCNNITTTQSVLFSGLAGGSFSAPAGLMINAVNGAITPSASLPGTYIVTYTVTPPGGGSNVIATTSVSILPAPTGSVSINILPSANPFCMGIPVTYTAFPTNGGTSPGYQWSVNNSNAGINSSVFSYTPSDNDIIKCIMTSSDLCAIGNPSVSNKVIMIQNPDTAIVTNTNDSGPGSLRQAILDNCNGNIAFNNSLDGQTIVLTSGSLIINKNIIFNNENHNSGITINGSGDNIIITAGKTLSLTSGSKIKISGTIINNAGNSGLILKSDVNGTASLLHYTAGVNASVERYIPCSNADEFHILASAVAAQSIGHGFNQTDGFYEWNEPTANWTEYADSINFASFNGGTDFVPAKGYAVSYPNNVTKSFSGILNQGVVKAPLTFTPGTYQGWNLVANPYPSAINWNASIGWTRNVLVNANIAGEKAIWIWNPDTAVGNYGTYISNDANGINGVSQNIAIGQGFWVKTAGNGFLGMTNDVRVHSSQVFLKSANISDDLLRLTVKGTANSYSDEMIVKFGNPDNLGGAEKMFSMYPAAPSLYSTKLNKNWSINYLAGFYQQVIVNVGFKAGVNGNYTFKANGLNSFNTTAYVYLKDITENIITDLNQNPEYSFTASSNDNANRFQLIFALSPLEISNKEMLNTCIYSFDNNIYINSNESVKQITIYNPLGQLIKTVSNDTRTIHINMKEDASAYYIVRVVTTKNAYTEKVFPR